MLILLGIVTVFPAYAGVILLVKKKSPLAFGLSRVCGGDPLDIVLVFCDCVSFPRMRG